MSVLYVSSDNTCILFEITKRLFFISLLTNSLFHLSADMALFIPSKTTAAFYLSLDNGYFFFSQQTTAIFLYSPENGCFSYRQRIFLILSRQQLSLINFTGKSCFLFPIRQQLLFFPATTTIFKTSPNHLLFFSREELFFTSDQTRAFFIYP